ncbi:hypothetical protein BDZ97DRAFT_87109 [Flammula alnicola]|nr:hypothetical protein BDZ97DRAFT_87109 [Flammula alnicola]
MRETTYRARNRALSVSNDKAWSRLRTAMPSILRPSNINVNIHADSWFPHVLQRLATTPTLRQPLVLSSTLLLPQHFASVPVLRPECWRDLMCLTASIRLTNAQDHPPALHFQPCISPPLPLSLAVKSVLDKAKVSHEHYLASRITTYRYHFTPQGVYGGGAAQDRSWDASTRARSVPATMEQGDEYAPHIKALHGGGNTRSWPTLEVRGTKGSGPCQAPI